MWHSIYLSSTSVRGEKLWQFYSECIRETNKRTDVHLMHTSSHSREKHECCFAPVRCRFAVISPICPKSEWLRGSYTCVRSRASSFSAFMPKAPKASTAFFFFSTSLCSSCLHWNGIVLLSRTAVKVNLKLGRYYLDESV